MTEEKNKRSKTGCGRDETHSIANRENEIGVIRMSACERWVAPENVATYEGGAYREVYCISGLLFDAVTLNETADTVMSSITAGQQLFLSTPNLNWLRMAAADSEFRDSTINSDLSIADGMPIVWISRLLGLPLKTRVSGSDLIATLEQRSNACVRTYFFGGEQSAAEQASRNLVSRKCALQPVGHYYPGFGGLEEMSTDDILSEINNSKPDFLVVSLGAKKGQNWIVRNREQLNSKVVSHLGAVVNFYAETVKRAPRWMQKTGLEWLWRIIQEPKLVSRYAEDLSFLIRLVVFKLLPCKMLSLNSREERARTGRLVRNEGESSCEVCVIGNVTTLNARTVFEALEEAVRENPATVINLAACTWVDARFIGTLLLLRSRARKAGGRLVISNARAKVEKMFTYLGAEFVLGNDEGSVALM